nr:hypothetical protein [Burkholderiales bacterium]
MSGAGRVDFNTHNGATNVARPNKIEQSKALICEIVNKPGSTVIPPSASGGMVGGYSSYSTPAHHEIVDSIVILKDIKKQIIDQGSNPGRSNLFGGGSAGGDSYNTTSSLHGYLKSYREYAPLLAGTKTMQAGERKQTLKWLDEKIDDLTAQTKSIKFTLATKDTALRELETWVNDPARTNEQKAALIFKSVLYQVKSNDIEDHLAQLSKNGFNFYNVGVHAGTPQGGRVAGTPVINVAGAAVINAMNRLEPEVCKNLFILASDAEAMRGFANAIKGKENAGNEIANNAPNNRSELGASGENRQSSQPSPSSSVKSGGSDQISSAGPKVAGGTNPTSLAQRLARIGMGTRTLNPPSRGQQLIRDPIVGASSGDLDLTSPSENAKGNHIANSTLLNTKVDVRDEFSQAVAGNGQLSGLEDLNSDYAMRVNNYFQTNNNENEFIKGDREAFNAANARDGDRVKFDNYRIITSNGTELKSPDEGEIKRVIEDALRENGRKPGDDSIEAEEMRGGARLTAIYNSFQAHRKSISDTSDPHAPPAAENIILIAVLNQKLTNLGQAVMNPVSERLPYHINPEFDNIIINFKNNTITLEYSLKYKPLDLRLVPFDRMGAPILTDLNKKLIVTVGINCTGAALE